MSRKDKEKQIPEEELAEEVPEETSGNGTENAEEASGQDGDALKKELEEANAKTAEYLAMAQRVQADFENYRKRNESVRADAFADGRREVAAAMLPVLDNLERAVGAAADSVDEALKNGMELVLKQMTDIYQKMDVTPIDRKGERFDPNLENAVLQGTAEEGEPGTVCQVLQKGYRMGDRVLRHAMVKVVAE
ncbi:MAG: nucleotide exchange factor GrpE [Clostridia bacterium]|nr:nucleotide exchange factor GrpE [Clostridia bacterium]